ncbi:MAG: amino acid permease [Proteobacteria bacterium]|nr:amino acid permease [Pseudomonadota bacterium]
MTDSRRAQAQADAKDLHQYGYAQELLRDMGGFANFAVSFTIISVITGIAMLFGHGLNYGGPAINGYGWPLVTVFTLAVAASMAEIASAIPTAGAMYHWSAVLGGPGWGWFTAWFNFIGQMTITAGIDYGIAIFLAGLLGTESHALILAMYAALLVSHGLVNHYGIRIVAFMNDFSAWYHIALTAAIVVAFVGFAPRKPLSFAFMTGFTTAKSGYAWAFLVGLLQNQWIYTGYDASAHITEETMDPRRNAPWGMILAVLVSFVAGYAILLAVTLAIQDLPAAAAAKNPFIFVAETALGPAFGKALLCAILVAMWCCGLSSVTANARMIFAFARDGGMPCSKPLARVSPTYRTPAAAVWVSVVLAFLAAIYSGAFNVVVSISTIGLYVSYILPVVLVLRERRRGRWTKLGPWNLGRWGALVNVVAIAWTAFISILFVAPPNELTGYTMAGVTVILVVYYFAWARSRFKGPHQLGTEEDLLRIEKTIEGTSIHAAA